MARTPATTTQQSKLLSKFGVGNVGYLTHGDTERAEQAAFDRLKAELTLAFGAPDTRYTPLTATEVIRRHENAEGATPDGREVSQVCPEGAEKLSETLPDQGRN